MKLYDGTSNNFTRDGRIDLQLRYPDFVPGGDQLSNDIMVRKKRSYVSSTQPNHFLLCFFFGSVPYFSH